MGTELTHDLKTGVDIKKNLIERDGRSFAASFIQRDSKKEQIENIILATPSAQKRAKKTARLYIQLANHCLQLKKLKRQNVLNLLL